MDLDWLFEAYHQTRKNGAAGVDGITAAEYEQDLEGNLQRLLERAKSGSYRAPPVRRVFIPKGTSTTEVRPIGIPTLEDKILQRAVVMLLEPVYKQDFLDCSYGFRPTRSAHHAWRSILSQTQPPFRERLICWASPITGASRVRAWVIKRKTAASRFSSGAISRVAQWCRLHRHLPISEQQLKLRQKLHGHYAYYGIRGNYAALNRFKFEVHRRWHKWLNRRNRQRELLLFQFNALLRRYPLTNPRIANHAAKP